MKYLVKCTNCGAIQWCRGEEDSETNAFLPDIDDSKWEGAKDSCDHQEVECIDSEYDEPLLDDR